jgi:hypothetical protein
MKAYLDIILVSRILNSGDLPPSSCIMDQMRRNAKPSLFPVFSFDLQKYPQQGILSKDAD